MFKVNNKDTNLPEVRRLEDDQKMNQCQKIIYMEL